MATLRVLGDYRPGGALMRLLTGARWRIGPRDLAQLKARAAYLVRPPEPVRRRCAVGAPVRPLRGAADPAPAADEREPLSLVEALDDLGPGPRLLAGRLPPHAAPGRRAAPLRRRLAAPLAELVADVEHAIGVGIEVDARPHRTRVGRVHLDRFLDEAAAFAAEAGDSSLRAFLAYLEAAEDEENGLEAGEVEVAAERVQILTVHAAKGLEWDLVAVPGLASDLFPGKGTGINWTRARHELPGPLRGDSDGLPALDLAGVESRAEIGDRLARHHARGAGTAPAGGAAPRLRRADPGPVAAAGERLRLGRDPTARARRHRSCARCASSPSRTSGSNRSRTRPTRAPSTP